MPTKETNKEKTKNSKIVTNKKVSKSKKVNIDKVAPKESTKSTSAKKTTILKKEDTEKRTTVAKKSTSSKSSKKSSSKATSKPKKVTVSKKVSNKNVSASESKKSFVKKATTKKSIAKTKPAAEVVEYYDLPYRYNETIVKVLYQTPDTLFVYWDISDKDRENYIKEYGENFFNITRPVLIIHNDTMKYSFEIPINDFANSWYLHINDSKCDYRIELGRRPNYYNEEAKKEIQENIHTDYIYVSSSNEIETPNDHVLFNTNENNTIKIRNVKTYNEKSVSLYDIVKHLPAMKRVQNIPYISEELLQNIYAGIYQNEDISFFDKLTNPSSGGNPSSGSMSSRFN